MKHSKNKKDSILITLHGIGTYGIWQRDFSKMVNENTTGFKHYSMKYGRISPLRITIPYFRKGIEKETMQYLKEIMDNNLDKDVHIIAHSFGTYLILKYLAENPEYTNIKTLILAGSVLQPDYFNKLMATHNIDITKNIRISINECGMSDKNLLMSKLFALNFGDGGRKGFILSSKSTLVNRFFKGGHKVYFNQESYKKYWLPHILGDVTIQSVDERKSSTYTRSLEIFYMGLSKFKYILHALIFIPVVIYSISMLRKPRFMLQHLL